MMNRAYFSIDDWMSSTESESDSVETDGSSDARDEQHNIKAPLWNHVDSLKRTDAGGENVRFRCKYCKQVYTESYSRVKTHLLKTSNGGIKMCPKDCLSMLQEIHIAKVHIFLRQTTTSLIMSLMGTTS